MMQLPTCVATFDSELFEARVSIWRGSYDSNEALAVFLTSWGEDLATLSVNMDHGQDHESKDLPANCFYAKEWGENELIAAECLASGWFKVRDDLPVSHSGYVVSRVWELLPERSPS